MGGILALVVVLAFWFLVAMVVQVAVAISVEKLTRRL